MVPASNRRGTGLYIMSMSQCGPISSTLFSEYRPSAETETVLASTRFTRGPWQAVHSMFRAWKPGTGRGYHNQAIALIGLCRLFSQISSQRRVENTWLNVLKICDDALRSAIHSGEQVTSETDKLFESAIQTLSGHASTYNYGADSIRVKMGMAKRMDTALYEVLWPPTLPMIVVNFVLLKTLSDPEPVVVRQMLSQTALLRHVLWNFSRFEDNRRITLQDNPHFYVNLPTAVDAYTGDFKARPVENLQLKPNATFYVLLDKPSRIFLEAGQDSRIFTNVFVLQDVMIFKDIHGVLEGESVVEESVKGMPVLWHGEGPFGCRSSCTVTRALHNHLPPIIVTSHWRWEDWRDIMRRKLNIGDNKFQIDPGQLPLSSVPELVSPPSPPTSERPGYSLLYTTVNTLNGDVLLKIFDICRLDDEESWNLQLRWCTLSHVCRKWRHLIHQSSFHLNMHILLTNGTFPLGMLDHLPPLPLVIDYRSGDATEIDVDILYAIQQRDRIRRIDLQAPAATLRRLIVPMDEPFLRLQTLSLLSRTEPEEDATLVLPRSFLVPNLRHLELRGIYLPSGLPLLTSTHSLVTLKLADIKAPGYFTPDDLVTQLQHIPQLEDVSIGFSTPMPRPNAEGELLLPPLVLTTLPALKRLDFRGVSVYLENLLSRISAPLLEQFEITLFNQLTFTLPRLSYFTGTTERLRHPTASIIFNRGAVSFVIGSSEQSSKDPFSLHISCTDFDWQIHSATQVCAALAPVLSAAEELTIDFEEQSFPADWQEEVDGIAWHDLLAPFGSVRKLCIGHPFASGFSNAMASDDAELVMGLVPELQELEAELEIAQADTAFAEFVDARQLGNRPVRLSVFRVLPALQSEPSPTFSPVSLASPIVTESSTSCSELSTTFSPVSLLSPTEPSPTFSPVSLAPSETTESSPSFSPVSLTPSRMESCPSYSPMSPTTPTEPSISFMPAPRSATPTVSSLLFLDPDELPVLRWAAVQKSWFRRTVVDPVLKRFGAPTLTDS